MAHRMSVKVPAAKAATHTVNFHELPPPGGLSANNLKGVSGFVGSVLHVSVCYLRPGCSGSSLWPRGSWKVVQRRLPSSFPDCLEFRQALTIGCTRVSPPKSAKQPDCPEARRRRVQLLLHSQPVGVGGFQLANALVFLCTAAHSHLPPVGADASLPSSLTLSSGQEQFHGFPCRCSSWFEGHTVHCEQISVFSLLAKNILCYFT